MYYKVRHYQYKNRIGNLKSEAVGVVSGEKHFPIFPGNMIFKPLTKSKPFSTGSFVIYCFDLIIDLIT